MSDVAEAAERLATQLGDDLPEVWRSTYHRLPRHWFVPNQAWWMADGETETHPIDRGADPAGWLDAVYSKDIIVTQRDERGRPTSSCSMPYMVFTMLALADIQPGHTVLEIGTGTGWSSALMAHRLGAEKVTTIEVDPDVAAQARRHHAHAKIIPTVITGDGAQGYSAHAPYDRVIATCAVQRVPYAWVRQTRPGGIILTPFSTPLGPGALLRLTVAADGTASGQFVHPASFMTMRGQRYDPPDEPDDFAVVADVRRPRIEDALAPDPGFAAGFLIRGVKVAYDRNTAGDRDTVWLLADDSWASLRFESTVRQHGTRRLWDEIEAAYDWWVEAGSPEYNRFGVTVTPDRQTFWLDDPHRIVTAELRSSAAPGT